MSLPTNNKQNGKKGNKGPKNAGGSKFITKPGKVAGNVPKKANRTGGTRGS
jgi:hypothetical protein